MNFILRLLGLDGGSTVNSVSSWHLKLIHPLSTAVLALLVALGLLLAAVNFLPQVKMRTSTRVLTFLLRIAMMAVLLVLVQQAELHLRVRLEEQQEWLILVDDSASMGTTDENGKSRFAAARAELAAIRGSAGGNVKLEVKTISGAELGDEPGKGPTFIQKAVSRTALAAAGIDRLVFLTDGRDTEGRDFAQLGTDLKARGIDLDIRVYGSEKHPKDYAIFAQPERSIIRLGEELLIQGSITGTAGNARGDLTVNLKENGKPVKQVSVPSGSGRQFQITHKPDKTGRHIYAVELPAADSLPMNNADAPRRQHAENLSARPARTARLLRIQGGGDDAGSLRRSCRLRQGGILHQLCGGGIGQRVCRPVERSGGNERVCRSGRRLRDRIGRFVAFEREYRRLHERGCSRSAGVE